jgi:hypothetical protein
MEGGRRTERVRENSRLFLFVPCFSLWREKSEETGLEADLRV